MRLYPIVILVTLSACATAPSGNDINARAMSWQGAPVDELVAAFGGQPGLKKEDKWYWQFRSPRESEGTDVRVSPTNTGSLSVLRSCPNCYSSSSEGNPINRAMPFATTVTSGAVTSGRGWLHKEPRVCTYIAFVEKGVITRLTTLSKPGAHCRFEELPLRSTD